MPSQRKFYRTVIKVEVLSEEPVSFDDLSDVVEAITTGDCSGDWKEELSQEVDGPTMARLLEAQGSDPDFFNLTEDGEDEES
jgi:hypothetical protein